DAAPLLRALEVLRALLNAHATGDLAHRSEQWKPTAFVAERFVCNAARTRGETAAREFFVGGKMKIREDDLALMHQRDFVGLRLLHLHDQIGAPPDLLALLD